MEQYPRNGMFSPDELAPEAMRPLPARAYLDEAILAHERENLFARAWNCVGREQELLAPGSYLRAPLTSAGVVVARGADLALRALHNVCQHRGACLVDQDRGRSQQLVCPYHGWTYGLDGALRSTPALSRVPASERAALGLRPARLAEHGGLIFVCPGDPWASIDETLDGLAPELARFPLRRLHLGRRLSHQARANWKLLAENFLESHHFPPVHPELERLTAAAEACTLPARGAWFGGTMRLRDGADTVSRDGSLGGRAPLLPGERLVHDYLLWPACMLSVQPDYLLVYRLWPLAADLTTIVSEIWFHPASEADPAFDPEPVFSLWDAINAQDRAICESQQRGVASPGFGGGRYVAVEESSHRFAAMVARSYLGQRPW